MKIGLFWIYKNQIIGKAIPVAEGVEGVLGIIDSNDDHIDLWENGGQLLRRFPELKGTEYQVFPRGRVLYSKSDGHFIVYMDAKLHKKSEKTIIREFFELETCPISWRKDDHYSTQENLIDEMFDDFY